MIERRNCETGSLLVQTVPLGFLADNLDRKYLQGRKLWGSPPCALLPTLHAHAVLALLAHRRVHTGSRDPTARWRPVKAALRGASAPRPRCVPPLGRAGLDRFPPLVRSFGSRAWWTFSVKSRIFVGRRGGAVPPTLRRLVPSCRTSHACRRAGPGLRQRSDLPGRGELSLRLVVTLPHGGLPSRSLRSAAAALRSL